MTSFPYRSARSHRGLDVDYPNPRVGRLRGAEREAITEAQLRSLFSYRPPALPPELSSFSSGGSQSRCNPVGEVGRNVGHGARLYRVRPAALLLLLDLCIQH